MQVMNGMTADLDLSDGVVDLRVVATRRTHPDAELFPAQKPDHLRSTAEITTDTIMAVTG
jgi:hypothetical protein